MRLFLTLLAALFFWGLVLATFPRLWRRRYGTDKERLALMVWLITLLLGISMTLHVDPIQAAIGARTGMNNLGWYLAYLVGSLGIYLTGLIVARSYVTYHRPFIRLLQLLFVLVLSTFTWLYVGWIRHSTEWTARSPRDWPEMLFLVTFFGFAAVAVTYWLVPLCQAWGRQRERLMRLRTLFGMTVCFFSLLCFGFKIAYALLGYWQPEHPWVPLFNMAALAAMTSVSLVIVPLLVPHRTYIRMEQLFALPGKLRLLGELRYLQERLHVLCPALMQENASWREWVARPDFYIYRTLVAILDSERMLNGYLERLDRNGHATLYVPDSSGEMRYWSLQSVAAARELNSVISIPPDAEYQEVLAYLRQVSRRLRRR